LEDERLIPEDELIAVRMEKLEKMRALGHDPFAVERYERWASVDAAGEQRAIEPYSADVAAAFEAYGQGGFRAPSGPLGQDSGLS
jgi:hypothetical protein